MNVEGLFPIICFDSHSQQVPPGSHPETKKACHNPRSRSDTSLCGWQPDPVNRAL
jgi:hypothetical protein